MTPLFEMAEKKPKKSAAANEAKESDDDFLKRILKTQGEATKKASEEIESYSKSKEVEELKATGKRVAKDLEEREECERIVEEFKIDPVIAISKNINGVSVEYSYEDKFKTKIELLKKHGFSFSSAVKSTYVSSPTFKAFGRAYARRGGQRISLPESSMPPVDGMGMGLRLMNNKEKRFVLEDGDVIETGKDSYVQVNDFIATDKYKRELFVYPNSEVKLEIRKTELHPEPAYMDPSKVPDAIKRNSSTTVINYNFVAASLVVGIFHLDILDENKNVNNFLKLASEYPEVEFLHSSKMMENIQDKIIAKMPANVLAMYKTKLPSRSQKICEQISAFIELCRDGSVVVFGTANSVKNKRSGKVASPNVPKIVPKDFIITGKITVTGDKIYSDGQDIVDPRARAIMKNRFVVDQYRSLLATKKEFEQKLKELKEKKSKPVIPESPASRKEKEKRKAELLDQQAYLKNAGDTEMADAIQMQLDELNPSAANEVDEAYLIKMITWCDGEIAKITPDLNSSFPAYNSPREGDAV